MSPQLGDSLIDMVLVNHIVSQGYNCTVYSNVLSVLNDWFPKIHIKHYPTTDIKKSMMKYDVLLHTYPHNDLCNEASWHPHSYYLENIPYYQQESNLVDIVMKIASLFTGEPAERSNGITPPENLNLNFRKNKNRIIIHPTGSHPQKYWHARYAIKLAIKLRENGFDPVFITSESEVNETKWIEEHDFQRFVDPSLSKVASFIYESEAFIGSDSGLAHLASALKIPTVTLHPRRKNKIRWHPGFSRNIALLPSVNLIYRPLKDKYWKYLITEKSILKAFYQIVS